MPFLPGDVYTNVPLTQAAVKLFQSAEGFVGRKAAPRMEVTKLAGSYKKWKQSDINRDEMIVRGPNSPTPVASFGHEPALFSIQARSLGYNLNDWTRLASDVALDPTQMIPMMLAYKAALSLERMFSTFAFAAANWYRTVTGGASDSVTITAATGTRLYMDNTSADPVKAIRAERIAQGKLTGWLPDAAIIGQDLFEAIRMHASVRTTLTNGSNPILRDAPASAEEVAKLCDLESVMVASAIYNTALENEAASNDYIVPPAGMLLYRRSPSMSNRPVQSVAGDAGVFNPEMPCGMARAQWTKAVGTNEGFRLRSFRDEDAGPGGSEKTVVDSAHDFCSVNSYMGTLFVAMLTP